VCAQSTAGTGLVAAYAASTRVAARQILVCWDGTNWVDESAYVLSCEITHTLLNSQLGLPMLGQGFSSEATLTLNNASGRFSSDVEGAIAHTYFPDGIYRVPIRIDMGYGGETLRQFTGEIIEAPGSVSTGRSLVSFRCVDYSYPLLQIKDITAVAWNQRVDQFMETLLAAADGEDSAFADHATRALDHGIAQVPAAWSDEENLWGQLGLLAASEMGSIHFSKEGQFRFWRQTAFLERASSVTPVVTLSLGRTFQMSSEASWRNAYTQVTVEINPWLTGPVSEVYQAQTEILVAPGESVTHWARLSHVCASIIPPVASDNSLTPPVAQGDFQAVSAGMADLSLSLAVATTAYAQQVKLVFTNSHTSQSIYVVGLKLRGGPLIGYGDDKKEYLATVSVLPGKKEFTVSGNAFLQTSFQAEMAGTRLRDLVQQPRRLIGSEGPLCPWLELGDRVTLPDASDALVMSLAISYSLATMNMRLTLLPVADLYPNTGYFVWGTSSYANSSSARAYY
jgi:hypothetical protein